MSAPRPRLWMVASACAELLAAVARERSERLAGQALRVHADEHRLVGGEGAERHGEHLLGAATVDGDVEGAVRGGESGARVTHERRGGGCRFGLG